VIANKITNPGEEAVIGEAIDAGALSNANHKNNTLKTLIIDPSTAYL